MRTVYPKELAPYVAALAESGLDRWEIIDSVARTFGITWDMMKAKSYMRNRGIKLQTKTKKRVRSKFPPDFRTWLAEIVQGRSYEELARMASERYGEQFTATQMHGILTRYGLRNGRDCRFQPGHESNQKGKPLNDRQRAALAKTQFQAGNLPHNYLPIGTVAKTRDGYLIKKVSDEGALWDRWKFLHRLVWAEANGPIPPGGVVTFLDGNKENLSLDNLALISQAERSRLTALHLRSDDPEITKNGIQIVRLMGAIDEKQKARKTYKKHEKRAKSSKK